MTRFVYIGSKTPMKVGRDGARDSTERWVVMCSATTIANTAVEVYITEEGIAALAVALAAARKGGR